MIADHSITNILCVSGISNIRFRAYAQSCTKSSLISFLQSENEEEKERNVLLETYRHMISLNIPSVWRIRPTKSDTLTLELWVFWFEDRHTGQVDASINHNELQEIAVGSLNWDQFMSKKSTPFDLDSNEDYKQEINQEYKLFIKAIRTLIQQSMTKSGRFCLGEFYVFPHTKTNHYHVNPENTMLACMYNIYLCSTNLVFQPNARRMRIRPLSMIDKNSVGLKVLLSPTGNPARLLRFLTQPEIQQSTVDAWAQFFHIDPAVLEIKDDPEMPCLVSVRTSSGYTVLYPTALIFVKTDIKISPPFAAGTEGMMGFNRGLIEDFGSKLSRIAYYDDITDARTQFVDYWAYRDPKHKLDKCVFDTLVNGPLLKDIAQLNVETPKPEPSPLPPTPKIELPSPNNDEDGMEEGEKGEKEDDNKRRQEKVVRNMSLGEYMLSHFMKGAIDMDPIEEQEEIMPTPNTENTQEIVSKQKSNDITAASTVSPEPQIDYIDSTWHMDSFEDLDFTVTEADFDFFESPVTTTTPAAKAEPSPLPPSSLANTTIYAIDEGPIQVEGPIHKQMSSVAASQGQQNFADLKTKDDDIEMKDAFIPNTDPMQMDGPTHIIKEEKATINVNTSTHLGIDSNEVAICPKPSYSDSELFPFIPSEFRPVSLTSRVNDEKYEPGGKYMYSKAVSKPKSKRKLYHPDYIPAIKRNSKKLCEEEENNDKTNLNTALRKGETAEEAIVIGDDDDDDDNDDNLSCDSDCSTCYTSSSNSSNSEYESGSEDEESNTDTTDRPELNIQKFKKSIVSYLVNVTRAEQPTDSYQRLEYDTPFSPVLTGLSVKPIKWRFNRAMSQSLDFLCQQAVWGGYPFAGGLSELTSNGGGLLSDPAKIMMLRRANLMQMTRGKVNHTTSIPPDWSNVVMTFKGILTQLFIEKEGEPVETSFLNEIRVSSTVDIKGPLNINQYYSLEDSGQQVHPKYGKFQVKKKRSTLPNLRKLDLPEMTVNRNDTVLEGSIRMFPFWEKLGLSPISVQKNVRYFVIYPQNTDIERTVSHFFKDLSAMYEACHLGIHRPGKAENYKNGLVPVPLIDLTDVTNIKKRLRSYEDTCEKFGKILAQSEKYKNQIYTVIYMINPGPYLSSNLDMCHCFYKLKEMYQSVLQAHPLNSNNTFVLQLLPMEHLIRPSAFGGYFPQGLKEIAFSVYCKCPTLSQSQSTNATTAISTTPAKSNNTYTPLFVLSKKIPEKIEYKTNNIRHFPVIVNQDITIHMTYCFSFNRNWMAVVWVDAQGNQLEHALFDRKAAYKEAWNRTLEIFNQYSLPGRIVITKIGLMFEDELLYWLRFISQRKNQVVIVSLDIETGLGLHFDEHEPNSAPIIAEQTTQSIPTSSLDPRGKARSTGVHERSNFLTKHEGQVQSLVLNHRVLYSQKRERAYKSILRTEALSETESWIMPLATGYLIHHLGMENDINPAFEQANTEPFVAEVHLIYNRTPSSAYITLQNLLQDFYSLSFIDPVISCGCLPYHVVLAERLSRLLLIVDNYSIQ